MSPAELGVKQAQKLPNLRDRTHGGLAAAPRAILLNGDGRGQADEAVYIRRLHLLGELAGVRAHHVHEALLPLRENDVKGESTLTAAGKAGDHGHPAAGNIDIDILELVMARTAQGDDAQRHIGVRRLALRRIILRRNGRFASQRGGQIARRMPCPAGGHFLRRALGDEPPALLAALRAEIDDIIRALDKLHVVFDDQQTMPQLHQAAKESEQHLQVVEMQAGAGFVENEQAALLRRFADQSRHKKPRKLEPLILSSGERIERLAQTEVTEPDILQHLQAGGNAAGTGVSLFAEKSQCATDV